MQPAHRALWRLFHPDKTAVKCLYLKHTDTSAAPHTCEACRNTCKLPWQTVIGILKRISVLVIIFRRKPQTETSPEIEILLNRIVKSLTFRTFSHQSRRQSRQKLWKIPLQHRTPDFFIISFCQF